MARNTVGTTTGTAIGTTASARAAGTASSTTWFSTTARRTIEGGPSSTSGTRGRERVARAVTVVVVGGAKGRILGL